MDAKFSDTTHDECPAVMHILDQVGSKWTVLIVGELSNGPVRFNALQRNLKNISHRILTLNLRTLEKDGLVLRRVFDTTPQTVEYELTSLGISLISPLEQLMNWVRSNREEITNAQLKFNDK